MIMERILKMLTQQNTGFFLEGLVSTICSLGGTEL